MKRKAVVYITILQVKCGCKYDCLISGGMQELEIYFVLYPKTYWIIRYQHIHT